MTTCVVLPEAAASRAPPRAQHWGWREGGGRQKSQVARGTVVPSKTRNLEAKRSLVDRQQSNSHRSRDVLALTVHWPVEILVDEMRARNKKHPRQDQLPGVLLLID
jgi:hypothetical protein